MSYNISRKAEIGQVEYTEPMENANPDDPLPKDSKNSKDSIEEFVDKCPSHTFVDDDDEYDVIKLMKISKSNEVHRIPIWLISHELFSNVWEQVWYNNRIDVSPASVWSMRKNKMFKKEIHNIKKANTSYALLVFNGRNPLELIDGYHRLSKLYFIKKARFVNVKYITKAQLRKCKIKD